jgi:8-oxo-dGTP diphosphatase
MPTIRVAAGVLTTGSHVLICQRRSQDLHPGKWEFPGGKVHEGEDGATCLWRELQEELRIDATIGAEIHTTSHTYPNGRNVMLQFFHVPSFRGDIVNTQFQALAWVQLTDLPAYDFLEGDVDFVNALASGKWVQLFSHP